MDSFQENYKRLSKNCKANDKEDGINVREGLLFT